MIVICDNCGKEFNKTPARIKRTNHNFCKRSCGAEYNTGKKRGPYNVRNRDCKLYERARELRRLGFGYGTIGRKINIPAGTVRNWVSDIHVEIKRPIKLAADIKRKKETKAFTSKGAIRKFLIRSRGHKCENCGLELWMGEKIWIEVHHIDGNKKNNADSNLKLLCLNCHAMTSNYRKRNL